jgi:cardiolipin synthase (CMP-forming)
MALRRSLSNPSLKAFLEELTFSHLNNNILRSSFSTTSSCFPILHTGNCHPASLLNPLLSLRSFNTTTKPHEKNNITTNTKKSITPNTTSSSDAGWSTAQVLTLPNALSLSRLISGPFIASWIIQEDWTLAITALAISAATDWLDGYAARHLNTPSVLGSYLDPLADKILVGCVVGALGWNGALPLPLVAVIVGRDVVLVCGAFWARAVALNWRWPGVKEFFRIQGSSKVDDNGVPVAHLVKPLFISKVNTGLQLGLVASCMTGAWLGLPGEEVVWGLGVATGVTTVWSGIAYGRMAMKMKF